MKKFMLMTVVALALLATPHAYTMNPVANKTAGYYAKLIAKKATSGTFSTLHWTIAGGYSFFSGIGRAIGLYDENILLKQQESFDANERITDFIQSKMRTINTEKLDGVKILPSLDATGMSMGVLRKNIMISRKTAHEINNAIIDNDQKTLDKWNGMLEHEASHRRHNDLFWRAATGIAMPFVTHGSVKVIRNLLPVAKKTRSFLGAQFIKIPTAFGKESITACATSAINRRQEQRADNEISNNIDLLNGAKSVLIDNEKYIFKILNLTPLKNVSPENLNKIRWVLNFREDHPLNKVRIQKIDQRIALLEKQSRNNS